MHLWKSNGWDWTKLSLQFSQETTLKTLAAIIPNTIGYKDTPYWELNDNGMFTTKSVYSLIHTRPPIPYNFEWIWSLHTLEKIKFFLQLCSHNRLPTKAYLHHIGLNIERTCSICNKHARKHTPHLFRVPSSNEILVRHGPKYPEPSLPTLPLATTPKRIECFSIE